jgi:hypothetical protein
VTDGAGDVTGSVGGAVGEAPNVGDALPPVSQTVDGVGNGAGQTVDGTVGGLPDLP